MSGLDDQNASFWNEPCGTTAALNNGFDLNTKQGREDFDRWYWGFYPYLMPLVDEAINDAKSVLEIGIGSGSLSRYLSTKDFDLTLLDVAPEALNFVNSSIAKPNLKILNRSILEPESKSMKFDAILAIGSLHHTGDLKLALDNVHEMLNPGGQILIMVYYAWQPRRVLSHPLRSLSEFLTTLFTKNSKAFIFQEDDELLRKMSDANSSGDAAPSTAYSSRKLFFNQTNVSYKTSLKNSHRLGIGPLVLMKRNSALRFVSPLFGCDIYAIGKNLKTQ